MNIGYPVMFMVIIAWIAVTSDLSKNRIEDSKEQIMEQLDRIEEKIDG